jgi:hypothetical protein
VTAVPHELGTEKDRFSLPLQMQAQQLAQLGQLTNLYRQVEGPEQEQQPNGPDEKMRKSNIKGIVNLFPKLATIWFCKFFLCVLLCKATMLPNFMQLLFNFLHVVPNFA